MWSALWVVLIVAGAAVVILVSMAFFPDIAGFFAAERKRLKDIERVRDEEKAKADKRALREKKLADMAKADQFCTNCMHRASRFECSCPARYTERRDPVSGESIKEYLAGHRTTELNSLVGTEWCEWNPKE